MALVGKCILNIKGEYVRSWVTESTLFDVRVIVGWNEPSIYLRLCFNILKILYKILLDDKHKVMICKRSNEYSFF